MRTRLEEAIEWLVDGLYGRKITYPMSRAAYKGRIAAYLIGAIYEYAAYRVFKYNCVRAPGTWLHTRGLTEERRLNSIDYLDEMMGVCQSDTNRNFNRTTAISEVLERVLPRAREFFRNVEDHEFPARFGKVAPRRMPAKTLTHAVKKFKILVNEFLKEVCYDHVNS